MKFSDATLLVGPPGTGKTTRLLEMTEGFLRDGYEPEDIGFLAFTRKAANEARDRAVMRFSLGEDRFPWFRTIHSLAFRALALRRQDIMSSKDYCKLAVELGHYFTVRGITDDGTFAGQTNGDRLMFTENLARASKVGLREFWERSPDEDLNYNELEQLSTALLRYKEAHGKLDFTDMLTRFLDQANPPPLAVVIVDEAQDLTKIQWEVIGLLGSGASKMVFGGDDDQSIFRWAGASTDFFIDLDSKREVLPQSYRVPKKIQALADEIISRVGHRIPKDWHPTDKDGSIEYVSTLDELPLEEGEWLLLARNVFLLNSYVDYCLSNGLLFESSIGSWGHTASDSLRAIRLWEALLRGEKIHVEDAALVYDHLSRGPGYKHGCRKKVIQAPPDRPLSMLYLRKEYGLLAKGQWYEALDRIPFMERDYYRLAEARGESLVLEPRIRINTIHGVKGGEAQNVVIQTDMAPRTWEEFQVNPDDEHRVWYVGVTRAKEMLWLMQPSTSQAYDIC